MLIETKSKSERRFFIMKKRVLSMLLAAAMAVSMLGGCANENKEAAVSSEGNNSEASDDGGSGEAVKATMTVWGPQEDQSEESGKWLQTMCEQFAAEHPEWELDFVYAVCPESDAKLTVAQDPEGAADVYMLANDHLTTLIASNAIAKLGGGTAEYVKTTNSQAIVDSVTVDGDIYAVPFTSNTWFMYYDKSIFSEEDIKSLDTMLEKGKVSFPVDNSWTLPAFFFAAGCTMFGDGTDEAAGVELGGDSGKAATDYIIDMTANPNFVNDKDGSALAGMRDGSVNAMFSGSWSYASVKEILGDNMGIAKLPTANINGEAKQLKSFAGSKAIGVNPNSDNMQVAVALAQYLASPDAQRKHYEIRNIIPCNEEVLQDETIKADPLVAAQNDTMNETSVLQPFVSKMDNVWKPVENFGKAILNHEVTHDNSAEMADKLSESANTSVAE